MLFRSPAGTPVSLVADERTLYTARRSAEATEAPGLVPRFLVAGVALAALLAANGLFARELPSGIIMVESPTTVIETPGRLVSRIFRLNFANAAELEPVVRTMLTARGTVATVASVNALVVTDEERVLDQVAAVLGQS